jgi:hypothetical protein
MTLMGFTQIMRWHEMILGGDLSVCAKIKNLVLMTKD